MPEPGDQPNSPKPVRTWRPMILWSAGILVALGFIWFVGAVVVPCLLVRAIAVRVADIRTMTTDAGSFWCNQRISLDTLNSEEAVSRLGGGPQAVRMIDLYLRMPDFLAPYKPAAVRLLAFCGPPAIPSLLKGLGHNDFGIRINAAFSLLELASEPGEPLPPMPSARGNPAAWAAVPGLLVMLASADAEKRRLAVEVLAELRPPGGDIAPLLREPEPALRVSAVRVLGKDRNANRALLAEALRDSDPLVRKHALASWDDNGSLSPEDIELLVRCLGDSSAEIRELAGWLLGRCGPAAVPILEKALGSDDQRLRAAAAEALKKIKGEAPVPERRGDTGTRRRGDAGTRRRYV
jgi:hypothetical protein